MATETVAHKKVMTIWPVSYRQNYPYAIYKYTKISVLTAHVKKESLIFGNCLHLGFPEYKV